MRLSKAFAASFAALALFGGAVQAAEFRPSADAIRGHMSFLADDLLQGREAGTPGYDIAAAYVRGRFIELGLKPAGDAGTFYQRVPLAQFRPQGEGTAALIARDGTRTELKFGDEWLPSSWGSEVNLTAPLVFAGYGIVQQGRDDYAGLDVRGKIVVLLPGAPTAMNSEVRAHVASGRTKRQLAAERGAAGVLFLSTPRGEQTFPFANGRRGLQGWSTTWADAEGKPFTPGAVPVGSVSAAVAARLFEGARRTYAQVVADAEKPEGVVRGFPLRGSFSARQAMETRTAESVNVAAMVEGSDPALKSEVVVLTAHLDHIGTRTTGEGDRINNGALDNASGIAALLETARGFVEADRRPRRSVLFLALTAEEKGLIGADFYARHPTVGRGNMVANVNLDMPILNYDFQDVIAFGAERSTIGETVTRAVAAIGVTTTPDPLSEEGLFTRSDHYRFVEQGVPSVFLMTGFKGQGEQQFRAFLRERYHRPNDDLSQPIDYDAGAKFAHVNYLIARELADADQRPSWKPGDFFGELFGRR